MGLKKPQPGTVLYRFQSADLLQNGFLFGTMHVNDAAAYSYYELAISCLKKCNLLATEIDLDIGSSYDMNALLTMKHGRTLDQFYRPNQYNKMRHQLIKTFDVDIEMLKSFVPIFIINFIAEKELMNNNQKSLDLAIWQSAVEMGMERTGLENFQEHYDVLKHIPLGYQAQQLLKLSKNTSRYRAGMHSVKQFYALGDLRMLYQVTKKSLGKMRKIMLHDRNHIISNSVVQLSQEHRLFAAMGASHLWGKFGVLALLKNQGYSVKPIFKV